MNFLIFFIRMNDTPQGDGKKIANILTSDILLR